LSLLEQFRAVTFGDKGGTYYIFQRDDHIGSLGILGIPDTGMGVYSNSVLEDVIGQVFITPFGSDRDCLSILDRRFWGMDERLDDLTSDGTGFGLRTAALMGDTPYTGYTDTTSVPAPAAVRPVLTDWVDYLLDTSDRIRALRNSWLTIRTDIKRGTLGAISRFDAEIPELKQKEQDYILQKKGLDEI
jgi:hypothetical protein